MANVEVDELQLGQLNNYKAYLERGLADKRTRRKLLEVQSVLFPDQAIPELDESDPLRGDMKALREEVTAFIAEQKEAAAKEKDEDGKKQIERDWLAGRNKLVKARYPEEAIPEIEKLMHERNIFDHEAAAALYDRLNPAPDPVLSGTSRMGWFDNPGDAPDIKALMNKDYDTFLAKAIPAAVQEFRNGGR